MARMNKIILDTQEPPDRNGIFDGDSFNDLEFRAWLGTVSTYPKITLRSYQKNKLISKIKKMSEKNYASIGIKELSPTRIEIIFKGRQWV